MQIQFDKLHQQLSEIILAEIFTKCAIVGVEIAGSMLIGSQVRPQFSRPTSDLDAIILIRGVDPSHSEDWYLEFNGNKQLGDYSRWLALKFFTIDSLYKQIVTGDLVRCFSLTDDSCILQDTDSNLLQMVKLANYRLSAEVSRVGAELKQIEIKEKVEMLRISFSEALSRLTHERIIANPILQQVRFSEFLMDFIIHAQSLICATQLQKNAEVNMGDFEKTIKHLLLLSGHRGGRMLDYERYFLGDQVAGLLASINTVIRDSLGSLTETITKTFNIMNAFFTSEFDIHLLLLPNEKTEAFGGT